MQVLAILGNSELRSEKIMIAWDRHLLFRDKRPRRFDCKWTAPLLSLGAELMFTLADHLLLFRME